MYVTYTAPTSKGYGLYPNTTYGVSKIDEYYAEDDELHRGVMSFVGPIDTEATP